MKTTLSTALIALALLGACAGTEIDDDLEAPAAEPVAEESAADTIGDVAAEVDTLDGDWTIEPTRVPNEATPGVVTLSAVRAANHAVFDRFVIAMEGGAFPGYTVEYAEDEVHRCGSGEPVEMAGDGMLLVRLEPARAHDDQGNGTLDDRSWSLDMPAIVEAEVICDFEAIVEIAIATENVLRYRLTTLTNPHRIVIDVRH